MPKIDLSMLNQRQTPAFYADVLANRPAAGFIGRIFVSTNTYAFYRDNGTGWDLIGGPGTGTVTGSGAANQVAFWSGASLIAGENNLWWDSANNHLGINTNTPATALDVNHNGTLVAKFNNTTSANTLVAFENAGNEQWWIGTENTNNDFLFYDATNFPTLSLRTTFKTSGQVLIGGGSTGTGKLVVESAASDNGIQIVGASAPSLRIDSAATGPTKRIGLGISTGANNFIQGSVDRDFCMFNGSTTASPILFGIYGTTNVQEAARISAARNFLIGTTTDAGQKLQVSGSIKATNYFLDGMTAGSGALYWASNRVTLANYNASGTLVFEVNGGNTALTLNSDTSATFVNSVTAATTFLGRNTFTTAGTNASPSFEDLLIGLNGNNAPAKIQIGNSFASSTGTWLKFVVNSNTATNTPIDALILKYDGAATFNKTVQVPSAVDSGFYILNYSANTSSRSWRLASDAYGYGDFAIQVSNTQTGTSYTNVLQISSSGNTLIGTTTDAGQKLQVLGTSNFTGNGFGSNAIQAYGANGANGVYSVSGGSGGAGTYATSSDVSSYGAIITNTGGGIALLVSQGNIRFVLPTSNVGLTSGMLWNNAGVVNIIP
jgi:hypothetical protein